MKLPCLLAAGLALACVLAAGWAPASAADRPHCLSPSERRAAIAKHEAVPLRQAVDAAKLRGSGDIVRARLCETERGLVYMLTVLSRTGKVTRATVDAVSGDVIARQ